MQKSILLFIFVAMASFSTTCGQSMYRPSPSEIAHLPAWAKLMYGENPDVHQVDHLYKQWFRLHPFEKSYHSQYYKRWRRQLDDQIGPDGTVRTFSGVQEARIRQAYADKRASGSYRGGNGWSVLGPDQVRRSDGTITAHQTNVYALTRCEADTTFMYVGTEPGEIYKSTDGGNSWFAVSDQIDHGGGLRAIAVDPSDPNQVYASSGSYLYSSSNGGTSWSSQYMFGNFDANEILVHPDNGNIIMIAADEGFFRSENAGMSWDTLYLDENYDVKLNTGNSAIVYLVNHNNSLEISQFWISTDTGATFTVQNTGWLSTTDPGRHDGGARIAVSQADPNRVYAYLIGESKTGDTGFIGVYRSNDGGSTWTLPNGPAGGPYTVQHPNLAIGSVSWQYHQGFYNCGLMASNSNADKILIGGLNLWRSDDGGLTFSSVSGYVGGPLDMHVDNQDFRAFNGEYWITTDGGIYKSTDFFNSQPEVKMQGIHGSDFWGFGSGWNEDVVVGGLYHNGNLCWYEPYASGEFLNVGGAESPTGYINPGDNRRAFFSDVAGKYLPLVIGDPINNLPFAMSPNESYFSANSSELLWHPHCYNIAWLGQDHQLWRTEDGGGAFSLVQTFGNDIDDELRALEISSSNPDVMYVVQELGGNQGTIWKTTDGGQNWASLSLPGNTNDNRILMQIDPENSNVLYIAYPSGANGQKIFKTLDGGANWTNLSTTILDGESVHSLVLIPGTDEGLYYCTGKTVYYKDNNLTDWQLYNGNLPVRFNTDIARPFFRDGKLRIASYGKGIWEAELHTQPSRPIARAMADHLSGLCPGAIFQFEDYSFLNHNGATWQWEFEDGSPAVSSQRNPTAYFNSGGLHEVVLTVTDSSGQSDRDTIYIDITGISSSSISEGFENSYPPAGWSTPSTGNLSWQQNTITGGYANSQNSVRCDNFNVDAQGSTADLRAPIDMDSAYNGNLIFDVAYAEYGGIYTDTMEILVSTDCGQSFSQVYRKGGQDLASTVNYTSEFLPSASEWRTDTVDLSSYIGNPSVIIAFRDIGHWGNVVYLDNINLDGSPVTGLEAVSAAYQAGLYPSVLQSGGAVRLQSDLAEGFALKLFNAEGKMVLQSRMEPGESRRLDLAAGMYFYDLKGESIWKRGKLLITGGR